MTDANAVRQEVESRVREYRKSNVPCVVIGTHSTQYWTDSDVARFALAEHQKVWEEAAKIAQKQSDNHIDRYEACDCADLIRSQAATERGEGKVQK